MKISIKEYHIFILLSISLNNYDDKKKRGNSALFYRYMIEGKMPLIRIAAIQIGAI